MNLVISSTLRAGNPELQDRLEVFRFENRVLLTIADGSGGLSGGAEAAELLVRLVRESAASLGTAELCRQLLNRVDRELVAAPQCGETTGLIVIILGERVVGAGVGDSLAWAFGANKRVELTGRQERKPLLGSGVAVASSFSESLNQGTVVIGTDGLWKYTSLEAIEKVAREGNASSLAEELSELVRLRSGSFPDDVAIATCRISQ